MEAAEEAEGETHMVADRIVLGFIQGVESVDSLQERFLASGVIFFEDTDPHLESIKFVHGVV